MSPAALAHDLFLGRYRPIRPLGAGGMGHVWLARDERSALDVALKIVPREGKSGHRAEREARAASALRHPHCQRILSLARDPSHVYIAYEYVPGRTLREAMRAGELDDRAAIQVCSQIADALAHAHGRGIVHRDVKPSNVLLAEAPDIDVRLLDFGLAQMAEFDTLTALGDIPGTLAYIAPERLQGHAATAAADVWAVGVVLWEALAGEHPFWGGDLAETSRSIENGAPPLETMRPDLPDHLLETVSAALVTAPQRRPTAVELAERLRSVPRRRRSTRGSTPHVPTRAWARPAAARALPATLAAVATAGVATRLPFYPSGWPFGLAAAGAALAFATPRAGLLFALAVAILPLGNVSLGLAVLYVAAAAFWAILSWRDARTGLLLVLGPVAAAAGALALLPLAAQAARGRVRRGLHVLAGVLLAGLAAGFRHAPIPLDGSMPPLGLGIAGSRRPTAVASALWGQLVAHPRLAGEAVVLALASVAVSFVRGRGPWPAAIFAATLLAATAALAPVGALLPLVAGAWITAAALGLHRPT